MPANLDDKLVVALSSRALFDFEEENAAFDEKDPARYQKLQLERLDQPAAPGVAFPAGPEAAGVQHASGAEGRGGDSVAQRPDQRSAGVQVGRAPQAAHHARGVPARALARSATSTR